MDRPLHRDVVALGELVCEYQELVQLTGISLDRDLTGLILLVIAHLKAHTSNQVSHADVTMTATEDVRYIRTLIGSSSCTR